MIKISCTYEFDGKKAEITLEDGVLTEKGENDIICEAIMSFAGLIQKESDKHRSELSDYLSKRYYL